MKTNIYIDGFNLYYGALKGTSYKWLDLRALFTSVLQPHHRIGTIKYFTARIQARNGDNGAPTRQDTYLRALTAHDPSVRIIEGHYLSNKVTAKLDPPIGSQRFASIIKTEEKGSDVNLAVHLLDDAWRGNFECAVIASNDSDLAESFRLVKSCNKRLVLIVCTPGDPKLRRTSIQLKRWANASRYLYGPVLALSQLPDPVLAGGQRIHKPPLW